VWAPEGHEGVFEAQTGMAHAARFPGRMGPARAPLERCLASSFRVRLHIYQKGGDLWDGGLFVKQSAARLTIIDSRIRSIQDFSPGGGD
jgi:hypothetical protein